MPAISLPAGQCDLGFARTDITPPVGIYHRNWGAAQHDASEGIHRPLTASALAFAGADSQERLLISLELGWLHADVLDRLTGTVSAESGLPADSIVITLSHTHAGGNFDTDRFQDPGGELIAPYLDKLNEQLGSLVNQALKAVQPVTLAFGTGRCDLACNRDFWDEENDHYACGTNPESTGDDTVVVVRVNDQKGQLALTLVNYGCHPTTLAWDNRLISPDYPGAMREVVEEATGAP